ncbi:hypothetical protein PMAYCL1PPCAC_28861, partial [Pristionchus mayeri]
SGEGSREEGGRTAPPECYRQDNRDRSYQHRQHNPTAPLCRPITGRVQQRPVVETFTTLEQEYEQWGRGDLAKELERLNVRLGTVRRLMENRDRLPQYNSQSYQPSPCERREGRGRHVGEERRGIG